MKVQPVRKGFKTFQNSVFGHFFLHSKHYFLLNNVTTRQKCPKMEKMNFQKMSKIAKMIFRLVFANEKFSTQQKMLQVGRYVENWSKITIFENLQNDFSDRFCQLKVTTRQKMLQVSRNYVKWKKWKKNSKIFTIKFLIGFRSRYVSAEHVTKKMVNLKII